MQGYIFHPEAATFLFPPICLLCHLCAGLDHQDGRNICCAELQNVSFFRWSKTFEQNLTLRKEVKSKHTEIVKRFCISSQKMVLFAKLHVLPDFLPQSLICSRIFFHFRDILQLCCCGRPSGGDIQGKAAFCTLSSHLYEAYCRF